MNLSILAVGLIGPGFSDWDQARPVLNGLHPYELTEPVIPPPEGLASAERRRVPLSVKIALAAAHQVFAQTRVRAEDTQTVFASSGGDGKTATTCAKRWRKPIRSCLPPDSPIRCTTRPPDIGASQPDLCRLRRAFARTTPVLPLDSSKRRRWS